MSTKNNNLGKALYDMFGVGATPEDTGLDEQAVETMAAEPLDSTAQEPLKGYVDERPQAAAPAVPTYLAEDTVLEGTLRTKGGVTIAGTFQGDIFAEGDVMLHTSVTGNVTARNMTLVGCVLTGECIVTGRVDIQAGSSVKGNIRAGEVLCSGTVDGDITASDDVLLAASAQVKGNITAGSLSVERGAFIQGTLAVS